MASNDLFGNQAKPVIDRPLIAYAFLAQTRQGSQASGDLLSGLAPIFKPIAKDRVGKRFDAIEFSKIAKALYAIDIHPWAVDDLAPRLEQAGLIVKAKISPSAEEYVYAEVAEEFSEVQEADIRLVIQKFIDFARPILVCHSIPVDEKALEDAFLSQLVSMDFHAILLKPNKTKDDVKSKDGKLSLPVKKERVEWEKENSAQSKIDVLCASFIMELSRNDQPLFDLVVRIATGALVAETVLNFQDPGGSPNLNTLRVVLDAPFVMSVLDLAGEESTVYARSLCEQLSANGATLQVFRHSIDEIEFNLKGAINGAQQGNGFGATARRLGLNIFKEYVVSVLHDVEGAVTRLGYRIVDVPQSTDSFQFFSEADEQSFKNALGIYKSPHAQERDAASIAAIIRLRRGKATRMAKIHQAQYIFITDNPKVADRADTFTQQGNLRGKNDVPPALTDRYIAGLLFVLYGGKATELTHYRLLANCTAALEARSDVMAKIHGFLSQLDKIKADQFRAIMTDERAGQHMMQLTLGESVFVTNTNDAEQILFKLEASLGEKYSKEHQEQIAEITKGHNEHVEKLIEQQQDLATQVRDTAAEVMGVRSELHGWKAISDDLKQNLETEKQNRLIEKRELIEDCVGYALSKMEDRHRMISWLMAIGSTVVTFAGTEYLTQFGTWISGVGAFLSGGLAYIGFSKNPDALFGEQLLAVRDNAFKVKTFEYRLVSDLQHFLIDWDSGTVSIK